MKNKDMWRVKKGIDLLERTLKLFEADMWSLEQKADAEAFLAVIDVLWALIDNNKEDLEGYMSHRDATFIRIDSIDLYISELKGIFELDKDL